MTNNKLRQIRINEEKDVNGNNHHKSMGVTDKQHENMKHHQQQQQNHHEEPISNQYNVNLRFDSTVPEAGRKTELTISVAESGRPVREFEFIHDKLMHLIIVGQDLSYFAHIHPTLAGTDGNFAIIHIFPESGRYKLWVDFKPKGGNQTLVTFIVDVKGLPTHKPVMPIYDELYTKESSDRNYRISLKLSQEKIIAKRDIDIVFSISDALGNPITDLEPLMGAALSLVVTYMNSFMYILPLR
ncbi:MAG TPA: hypothetical protein VFH25_08305 [Nitrososphaeraceae archaeon]|nr:hypothetical protein [Nitrososphaeraceae archaeon]